ncbi:MAG: ferritin-like domain-containing protein [Gammaproteobacteria bacterium]
MNTRNVISTLNGLIETCKDGEEGFRTCAENVRNAELKRVFMERSQHCAKSAEELQSEVRRLGGDPETHGSVLGALHRRWLNVKTAITSKDEAAVLAECERGEDMAVVAYKNALAQDLASDVRKLIERQYQGAIANHDLVRGLRDSFSAAA